MQLPALDNVNEPWFVRGMGEEVTPIYYRGETHDRVGYWCELQHRSGGRLSSGEGQTLNEAIEMAIKRSELRA